MVCPCFVPGEEAGAVLDAPADHYPLEILRVGIGWGSQFGGSPQSLEQAIKIYAAGLPNPGAPIFTLPGPQLTDGVINEFDLEPLPDEIAIDSGPFTVTLEFLNSNAGDPFAPSVVHDGNGCQGGKNVVYAVPGGWNDACLLGVTGDWVFYVIYRPCLPGTGVGDAPQIATSSPVLLLPAQPNPFTSVTELDFFLAKPGRANVSVYDVAGRRVATLIDRPYPAGTHRITWNGDAENSERLPSGMYFVRLNASGHQSVTKVLLTK
ncbi:MAG: T9SS type A sorting domain-containing protein [Candidatus Latescibacterota bacterium]|nr:MAG: T9SS type A sorting domain-containing protein [Candidatus Latescibacterota bacterium]